ncbi:MAG: protease pro-enzyme activation domain-containing protein [Steroidobacteraceae bacterium]
MNKMIQTCRRQIIRSMVVVTLAATLGAQAQSPATGGTPASDSVGVGKQQLSGYRRADFANAPLVGPLGSSAMVSLAIGLPIHHAKELDSLAREVSDPKSPNYRKFITPEEAVKRFSPSAADYAALTAFARAHGLTVDRSYGNRYLLDVSGTVEVVQKAFHVKLNHYRRPDGTVFFAPDREPSLDFDLPVSYISGFENYVLPRQLQTPYAGSGPQGNLNSVDLRNVYTNNNRTLYGQGQTVGLIESVAPDLNDIYGNGTPASGYVGQAGLPAGLTNPAWPAGSTAPPLLLWPAGTTASVINGSTTQAQINALFEPVLDVEMAIAMAPGLDQIVVYTLSQASTSNYAGAAVQFDSALNAMASPPSGYPLPLQISSSLALPVDGNAQPILKTLAFQGQSFFAASGDEGAYNAPGPGCGSFSTTFSSGGTTLTYLNLLDDITVVGGTLWTASSGAPYSESEIGWSWQSSWPQLSGSSANAAGGGGIITGVPLPGYQSGFATNGASSTSRNIPDVAAVAAGVFIYWDNGVNSATGTSVSSPLWAGFSALVNQQRQIAGYTPVGLGFLNPTLYGIAASSHYTANFHDVTVGTNATTGCSGFNAGTGYDLVTGLGSPKGQLITSLAQSPRTAANEGDPHLATVDAVHYDFQSAGEFVVLRDGRDMEIQTRQTPVSTAPPAASSYTGLATCVSVNTAVAARVGNRRVTYQPNPKGGSDADLLELRIDGVLTKLGPNGLSLAPGGRVETSPTGTGIAVSFPDGTVLVVTPNWWSSQNLAYLNVDVFGTPAYEGVMGSIAPGSWLPALPNGTALGAMPATLHQRYTELYHTFTDAWRVTAATSLFDYAPGTSTATYTHPAWPPEQAPCVFENSRPSRPLEPSVAQKLCGRIADSTRRADCVFDTRITGDAGFAKTYQLSQRLASGLTTTTVRESSEAAQPNVITFVASVALAAPDGSVVPSGSVQFVLGGTKVGAPVPLDAKGDATRHLPRQTVGTQHMSARYIPTAGGVFLTSSSLD